MWHRVIWLDEYKRFGGTSGLYLPGYSCDYQKLHAAEEFQIPPSAQRAKPRYSFKKKKL
jgi:hypothetical protein